MAINNKVPKYWADLCYIISAWGLSCSFHCNGQSQGLGVRDG